MDTDQFGLQEIKSVEQSFCFNMFKSLAVADDIVMFCLLSL